MMADKNAIVQHTLLNSTGNVEGRKEALCPCKKKNNANTENKSITTNFKQQFLSVIKINVNR